MDASGRMMLAMRFSGFFIAFLGAIAWSGSLRACPIPVYQYALEHWAPDPYEITVYRDGDLDADQREALEILQRAARGEDMVVNLELRIRDSGENDTRSASSAARLEVRYPKASRLPWPVWEGALTADNVRALLASPVRARLAEALLRRTSAVWILLESGDPSTDRELETLLTQQLARLERTIVVPETAEWGGQSVEIDHQVDFSVLRVRRDDPAEYFLVRMLLATEADLETEFDEEPMVFPVYGRGLVLYALVGRGINAWTIGKAAEFLTGPCSCQIKADNPGTDLLMAADWAAGVQALTPATVGGTAGTGAFLQRLDEAEKVEE